MKGIKLIKKKKYYNTALEIVAFFWYLLERGKVHVLVFTRIDYKLWQHFHRKNFIYFFFFRLSEIIIDLRSFYLFLDTCFFKLLIL